MTQAPAAGNPGREMPVLIWYSAGTWSFDSLCSDLMNAKSSTCLATFGYLSQTHAPLWPYCWNLKRRLHQRPGIAVEDVDLKSSGRRAW